MIFRSKKCIMWGKFHHKIRSMFSYEHLSSFCATVEEGSYSRAARKLGKDRTTIREQIKVIEESYAVSLFHIEGKAAVVTETGAAIYKQAKLLVKHSERLNTRLLSSYMEPVTQLDVFHDVLVPPRLVVEIEHFMTNRFPYIKLNWLHKNREEALKAVSEGTNQLALMQHRLAHETLFPLGYAFIGTQDIALYCHPDHTLAKMEIITVGDLQLEKQYISENLYKAMPELFALSPDLSIISNNDVLLELLQYDGWSAISTSLAKPLVNQGLLKQLVLVELETSLKLGISFFYPEARDQTPEIQALIKFLKTCTDRFFL